MRELTIVHLYPDEMNLYGDRGNILTLMMRAKWRGIETKLVPVRAGESFNFESADLLFMGGGQDRGQKLIAADLTSRAGEIKRAVENYLTVLLICGGYQLFGKYFKTVLGETIPGIDVLDITTIASPARQIGNVVVDIRKVSRTWETQTGTMVGFENHSGQTYLGANVEPIGITSRGHGNNRADGTEGAYYKNCFGSYLHGSLLPKNPAFADHLLTLALHRKYGRGENLARLDDSLEMKAHQTALELVTKR